MFYVLAPVLCWRLRWPIILVLVIMSFLLFLRLRSDSSFDRGQLARFHVPWTAWRRMFLEWLLVLPLLGALVWCLNPRELFRFPREQPVFWAVVMVAYPILSVWPQEIIYRAYFLHRYRPILGNTWLLLLASSVAFAFAHIVFANSIAIILTFVAGWLFATTYMRTRSLPLVAVQHSLYGCAVFTIGLGHYFYHGTARFLEGIAHSHSGL